MICMVTIYLFFASSVQCKNDNNLQKKARTYPVKHRQGSVMFDHLFFIILSLKGEK